jgi:hypothetical protein
MSIPAHGRPKPSKRQRTQGKSINVAASSEDRNFAVTFPENIGLDAHATYAAPHLQQYHQRNPVATVIRRPAAVPLVSDMSSDILSTAAGYGTSSALIYAGAQKNMGPAGVCLVIIRDDHARARTPTDIAQHAASYTTYAEKELHVQYATLLCHLHGAAGTQMAGGNGWWTWMQNDGVESARKLATLYDYMDQRRLLPRERQIRG